MCIHTNPDSKQILFQCNLLHIHKYHLYYILWRRQHTPLYPHSFHHSWPLKNIYCLEWNEIFRRSFESRDYIQKKPKPYFVVSTIQASSNCQSWIKIIMFLLQSSFTHLDRRTGRVDNNTSKNFNIRQLRETNLQHH